MMDSTTYDKLSCPECPQIMKNSDVKLHAPKDVYMRFDELVRRGIAEKIPGWRWCMAPKCRAGQVHQPLVDINPNATAPKRGKSKKGAKKSDGGLVCTCSECGAKACVGCDRPWHEGETCTQYKSRVIKKEEKASLEFISKECKKCPKCSKNIERNGGCDHMSCTQCRTQFCWLCLTTYDIINKQSHSKDCMYAQPNRIDPHAIPAPLAMHPPQMVLAPNGGGLMGGIFNGVAAVAGAWRPN